MAALAASGKRTLTEDGNAEWHQIFKEYGIARIRKTGAYEVDHLIALELGGSNDIKNLWPEASLPIPGFHQKDFVENYLHRQVCSGKMMLQAAQQGIATNWKQYLPLVLR